ncbi:MAG: helix-turn-helix transcriptional regulator [Kiloniellales bacterium]
MTDLDGAPRLTLQALRLSHGLTQGEMAKRLDKAQATIAQLEGRDDATVSNLRAYIEAMGGSLDLVATFPDSEPVVIDPLTQPGQNGRKR